MGDSKVSVIYIYIYIDYMYFNTLFSPTRIFTRFQTHVFNF